MHRNFATSNFLKLHRLLTLCFFSLRFTDLFSFLPKTSLLCPPRQLLTPLTQRDAKLGPRTNGFSFPDEDEGNDAHDGEQAAEQRAGARDAEALKHARRGKGQHDGENGAAR